jgi:hypothetical protein
MLLSILIVNLSPSLPWFLDRGLERSLSEMQQLFRERELFKLYSEYADIQLKMKIGKSIDRMKQDKINAYEISKSLKFKRYRDFLSASHDVVIMKFFFLMLHPPKKKGKTIENAEYLRLALLLSLMFAHFDKGMEMVDRHISGNVAKLTYSGNGFTMIAYYVFRKNRWYISDRGLIK